MKTVDQQNLKVGLDELSNHVDAKLPAGSRRRNAYEAWIKRMHAIRLQRNQLVHGRGGIEPQKNKVMNVIGLLGVDSQKITEYTIEELAVISEELRSLELELSRLRQHWPL